MEKKKNCGCCKCNHPISQSVGELVILITRDSFNIAENLPYCIWGSIYISTNYGAVLQPYLPAGVTVASAATSAGVVFTYTQGLLTDTITVTVPTLGLISYVEAVTNLKTNYMNTCFAVFNCNAANAAPFLTNSNIYDLQSGGLYLQKVGAGGNKDAQLIIPATRRQINNSIPNMIELYLRNEPIKAETVWVHQFVYFTPQPEPPSPISFNLTVFYSERVDMNAERGDLFDRPGVREPRQGAIV